jgi:hypothetical protein
MLYAVRSKVAVDNGGSLGGALEHKRPTITPLREIHAKARVRHALVPTIPKLLQENVDLCWLLGNFGGETARLTDSDDPRIPVPNYG